LEEALWTQRRNELRANNFYGDLAVVLEIVRQVNRRSR